MKLLHKNLFRVLLVSIFLTSNVSCTTEQLLNTAGKVLLNELTEGEVSSGLKEALVQGISLGVNLASKEDGYNKNSLLRIPFPPDAQKVANTLNDLGFKKQVDRFVTTLNRGAENAAKEAKPIFVSAIKGMTVQDAFGILKGENNAATSYLRRTTEAQLMQAFEPHVKKALDQVNATKYYSELVGKYNGLPTTFNKVNPDLVDYATKMAIDGLFKLVAKEEAHIRTDISARTSDLMKKVFAAQDKDN